MRKRSTQFLPLSNAGFGSSAALRHTTSLMSAFEREAVVQQLIFERQNLNVRFSRKRSFNLLENRYF